MTGTRTIKPEPAPVIDRKIPALLTTNEVAELLEISRQAVLQMINAGRLPAQRAGQAWVVRASVVTEMVIARHAESTARSSECLARGAGHA